jgi:N-acetylmuramoyl-L-alanine amidase
MRQNTPLIVVILISLMSIVTFGTAQQPNVSDQVSTATVALEIVSSPIAENCYGKTEGKREIDTVVVHYASAIYWFDPSFQKKVNADGKVYAESIGLTKENLAEHKYDWQMVKAIFEAYKVSSHYAIGRDGTIVSFVPENDKAYHAGKSTMPTDGRESVNNFSVGIEMMSSHPKDDSTVKTAQDAYTEAQYVSLHKLITKIAKEHDVTAVVGHDEIAIGRKTDPGPLFDWTRVRTEDYKPLSP